MCFFNNFCIISLYICHVHSFNRIFFSNVIGRESNVEFILDFSAYISSKAGKHLPLQGTRISSMLTWKLIHLYILNISLNLYYNSDGLEIMMTLFITICILVQLSVNVGIEGFMLIFICYLIIYVYVQLHHRQYKYVHHITGFSWSPMCPYLCM